MKDREHSYLNEVTNQIRSKEAQKYVEAELSHHLQVTKNTFIKGGLTEEEAEAKAIEQMGNPVNLGIQLNRLHRPKVDWMMILLLAMSFGLGFLPMLSLDFINSENLMMNKVMIVLLGTLVTVAFMFFDYRKLQKYKWHFFAFGIFILSLLFFFPDGYINGIPRLRVGHLMVESSMSLPFFFLFWAAFLKSEGAKLWTGLLFLLTLFPLFFSSGIAISFIYLVMFLAMLVWSNVYSKKALGGAMLFLVVGVGIATFSLKEYQLTRILGFFNPEAYSESSGYLYLRANELMSAFGWFGNTSTGDIIPEPYTNFVFVNFTFHFGWLLAIFLVFILASLMTRMLFVVKQIRDSYGKMLIIGGVTLFSVQFLYHIAMTMGWLPITSMSLPFISYGLMPTILNAIIIGIFLSVYRRKDLIDNSAFK